jgi:hypothetical protein
MTNPKIIHFPIQRVELIIDSFSIKEETPITYVLTSTLPNGSSNMDIFYRNTPHPVHGNHYLGVISKNGDTFITNADSIESICIGMVKDGNGNFQYNSYRHNYKSFDNGSIIGGGRDYTKGSKVVYYQVIKGKLVPNE